MFAQPTCTEKVITERVLCCPVLCLPWQCFQLSCSFNHDDPYCHEFNTSLGVSLLGDSVSVLGDSEFAELSFPSLVLWSGCYFVLC